MSKEQKQAIAVIVSCLLIFVYEDPLVLSRLDSTLGICVGSGVLASASYGAGYLLAELLSWMLFPD